MNPELYARDGEKILPKWRGLMEWIRRQQITVAGGDYTVTHSPSGTLVTVYPEDYAPIVRFPVTLLNLAGTYKVKVGDGTVNGITPKVNGVPITGQNNPPQPAPQINTVGPDMDTMTSLVTLKTTHLANGNLDTATIECKKPSEIPGGRRAQYAGTGGSLTGYLPLALIRHDPSTRQPASVLQLSVHNLQARAFPSPQGPRIFYWPA